MNENKFRLKFYNDVLKEFPDAKLENDSLEFFKQKNVVSFSVDGLYNQYSSSVDYKIFFEKTIDNINMLSNYVRTAPDLNTVYPLIKLKGTVETEEYDLTERGAFLDICYFIVSDIEDILRFVPKDQFDEDILRKNALENLSKLKPELELVSVEHQIYSYYGIDFAASLILLEECIEEVKEKLGDNFCFIISNSDSLVFAPLNVNHDLLNRIISCDMLPRVSEAIYTYYNNGHFSYADKSKNIRLVE